MKKIVKIWLVLVMILSFTVNVYAVDGILTAENPIGTPETKEGGQETTDGSDEDDKKGNQETGEGTTTPGEDKDQDDTKPSTDGKSNKAELISITINGSKAVCNSKSPCESNDAVDSTVTSATISYEISEKAKITDENGQDITSGENRKLNNIKNEYTVTVTAEDGSTKKYDIVINKKVLDTDASLKTLIINGEEVALKSGNVKYNATVSYTAKSIEVEAVPKSGSATVAQANKNKITYDFTGDTKEIKIKVTSQAGDSLTYTINVTRRPEEDATLKDITIENYDFDFDKDTTEYEISVLKDVEKLDIKATPTDVDSDVKIDQPEKLELGENKITITVTNDGTVKTYTIKVNKLDEEDKSLANLESLTIDGYDLDFKEDVYEYDLKIGDVNTLDIKYKTKSPDASVQVTGNMDLINGSIVKVRVTYTSGLTNVYRINIIKEEVKENNKNNTAKIIIIIAIILILIAAALLVLIQIKNKKDKGDKKDKPNKKGKSNKKGEEEKTVVESVPEPTAIDIEKIATANPGDIISMPPDDIEDII